MRFIATRMQPVTKSAVFWLAVSMCVSVYAGGKPEKIEFSDPGSSIVASNLSHLDTRKSPFKQAEEDLFKPFQPVNPRNSLDGVMTPFRPQMAPPLSTRQLEQIEERKNWAFTTATDLLPKNNLEEALHVKQYGADGQEKKSLSPIEKYYESLGNKRAPTTTELSETLGGGRNRDFAATNGFNPLGSSWSSNGSGAWILPATDAATAGNPGLSIAEQNRARQHRLEFNNLLEGRSLPEPSAVLVRSGNPGPVGLPGNFGNPTTASASAFPTPGQNPAPVEYRNAANPILGAAIHPNLVPRPLQDPTARALGIPQPEFKQPEPPPKKPVSLQYNPPQRKF